jgi:hypothetical protein
MLEIKHCFSVCKDLEGKCTKALAGKTGMPLRSLFEPVIAVTWKAMQAG